MNRPRKVALLWILVQKTTLFSHSVGHTEMDIQGRSWCQDWYYRQASAKSLIIPPLGHPCMNMEGKKAERQPGHGRLLSQEITRRVTQHTPATCMRRSCGEHSCAEHVCGALKPQGTCTTGGLGERKI